MDPLWLRKKNIEDFFEKDKTMQNDLFFSTYIQARVKDSGPLLS